MKTAPIGQTELIGSSIVLGTWAIGGTEWGGTDEEDSIRAIQAALDEGINFIDTAPVYGYGLSEEIVGKACAGSRDRMVIATKVGLRWDSEDGEFNFESGDGHRIYRNLSPKSIRAEVENSLRRLQTDYIDLLQTHWPESTTPIDETMETLLELKKEGKIRAIGGCNLSTALFQEYSQVGPLDTVQEMYSMVDRQQEQDLFPVAIDNGASVLAYSPLAMGLLTGKIGPDRVFGDDDVRSWSPRFTTACREQIQRMLQRLAPLAAEHGISLAQLVIAWTVAQPLVTHVLCGIRTPTQAMENAHSGTVELSSEDLEFINTVLEEEAVELPHPFKI